MPLKGPLILKSGVRMGIHVCSELCIFQQWHSHHNQVHSYEIHFRLQNEQQTPKVDGLIQCYLIPVIHNNAEHVHSTHRKATSNHFTLFPVSEMYV